MIDIAYTIDSTATILEAIKRLSKNKHKGLVVIKKNKVVDVFTRFDMVRNLHSFGNETMILESCKKECFFFYRDKLDEIDFQNNPHAIIPIISDDNTLLDIVFPQKKVVKSNYEYPVAIMAGGLGTRLYPYTKILPKPLVPINGTPMVEIIMNKFVDFGSKDFYLIVNHKKEMIQAYFDNLDKSYNVSYGIEHRQLGTGGGLYYIKDFINDTFFLTNCDTLLIENYNEIFEYHKDNKNMITMIVSVKSFDIPYGVIDIDSDREVSEVREKPSYGLLVNTGMYVVDKKVLNFINEEEAIGFPDVIERVKAAGGKVSVYPITEDCWLDMGEVEELEVAKKRLAAGI